MKRPHAGDALDRLAHSAMAAPYSGVRVRKATTDCEEGRHAGMYGWIWRHLPGNTWVRALCSLVLALGVVFLLFQYIFPWAEPLLPFNDVTVDGGGS